MSGLTLGRLTIKSTLQSTVVTQKCLGATFSRGIISRTGDKSHLTDASLSSPSFISQPNVTSPLKHSNRFKYTGVRQYSVEPRSLKSSGFATPKQPVDTDFSNTKLVHGNTHMKLGITSRAKDKLNHIASSDNNPDSGLLIKVESGGCHGFQYDVKLTSVSEEINNNKDILVFKRMESENDDAIANVIIDESSLQILQDSKLDYTKELIGSQFKMVDSPYTTSACGCGSSFDFDFEKLAQNSQN